MDRFLFDLVVVGAGLYGATFTSLSVARGLRVLVIDRRLHPGGNCHSESVDGIEVHKYGPHIFHTSDRATWDYVRRFSGFLEYRHRALACSGGILYPFPVNLETLRAFHPEARDPEAARRLLASFRRDGAEDNFEDHLLGRVGERIYRAFYHGYTSKQWGRDPRGLPASIARRIPVRADAGDRYFDDPWEGIPEHGYTAMIRNMLRGAEVRLGTEYFRDKAFFDALAPAVLYTGELDRYFGHRFGKLEYRSLEFEEIRLERERFQPRAIVNYCDASIPYTRITEHKHFTASDPRRAGARLPHTIVTREYPGRGAESLYPVNDAANNRLYARYAELAAREDKVLFGGRLAEYRYFDMDHVVQAATRRFRRFAQQGYRKERPA